MFGVTRAIVVTQTYHLPRAVALCRALGIAAVGVGDDGRAAPWTDLYGSAAREQLATVRAVADVLARRPA